MDWDEIDLDENVDPDSNESEIDVQEVLSHNELNKHRDPRRIIEIMEEQRRLSEQISDYFN